MGLGRFVWWVGAVDGWALFEVVCDWFLCVGDLVTWCCCSRGVSWASVWGALFGAPGGGPFGFGVVLHWCSGP